MRRGTVRTAAGALALAAVAILSGTAFAKAPQGMLTLEDIRQRAEKAEAEAARAALEAQKDPNRDAIEAYKSGKAPLTEWHRLVEILTDAKTAELQDYRPLAAEALIQRFEKEKVDSDPQVRQIRIDIALELVELLGAPSKDDKGILAAGQIFYSWYRPQVVNNKWKAEAKQSDRARAARKIKDWLKKSEKD